MVHIRQRHNLKPPPLINVKEFQLVINGSTPCNLWWHWLFFKEPSKRHRYARSKSCTKDRWLNQIPLGTIAPPSWGARSVLLWLRHYLSQLECLLGWRSWRGLVGMIVGFYLLGWDRPVFVSLCQLVLIFFHSLCFLDANRLWFNRCWHLGYRSQSATGLPKASGYILQIYPRNGCHS